MAERNQEAFAAVTLLWSITQANIPGDIMTHLDDKLREHIMPQIASCSIAPSQYLPCMSSCTDANFDIIGPGYEFKLNSKIYSFPQHQCSPPEAYMSQDYEA
jgi:hypothetical protein